MKNRICLAFLLMATAFYTTKADEITFNSVTFEPGGQAELVIEANLTNANITSYQFDIYLPEGISVAYDEDEEDYVYSLSGRHKKDHTLSLQEHSEYGFWRFIVSSNSNKLIRSGEGELLTLTLQASPIASGTHTVQVKNIKMAEPDQTSHVLNNTSFNLTVNSVVVNASSISLDKTTLSLTSAEQTTRLIATVLPTNTTNKSVTWTSSKTSVATVDATGLVTAKTNGTAIITATTADGTNLSASCEVTVNIPVAADEFTFNSVTIDSGDQAELVINATLSNANITSYQFDIYLPEGISVAYDEDEEDYVYSLSGRHKKDHTLSLQEHSEYGFWRFIVSSNSNKLIRSGEGELLTLTLQASPIASGTHTVQVKNIKMAEPDQTSHVLNNTSFNLTVNSVVVNASSISLDKTTLSLTSVDQTSQLTATVLPANATNKSVTWTSSNTSVATVDANGVVTAKANGTATITATTVDGTNLSATCQVAVNIPTEIKATSISLDKTTLSLSSVGQTSQLTATVLPTNATNKSVTWTSSNTSVATVDANGLVTAKANGTATITATTTDGSNKSATCSVTVSAPILVTGVSLSQTSLTFSAFNATQTLTATVTPSNAANKTLTWTSSNTSVATVSSNGVVTSKGYGTATITAKTTDGSNKSATCSVTVVIPKYTLKFVADGTVVSEKSVDYGSAITAPNAPAKTGYTFVSWGNVAATMPANDVTYTAQYSINQYTITFKVDGEVYKTLTQNYGTAITKPQAPTKEGYTFSGWQNVASTVPAQNLTYEASFTINKYTLKFVAVGTVVSEKSVDYGSSITAPNAPAKTGYTFVSWGNVAATMPANDVTYTAQYKVNKYKVTFNVDGKVYKTFTQNYGTAIVAPQTPTKEGYTFSCWKDIASTVPAHDVTYEAIFTINKYKLKFVADGTVVSEKSVDYGSAITAPNAPAKTGYTFVSWGNVPSTMPAKDVTYTAEYKVNQYKLIYMIDGVVYKTFTLDYDSIIIPEGDAEDDDYYYGWEEIPDRMPDHDVTVNAYITGIAAAGMGLSDHKYEIYTIDGKKLNNLQKGVNIIRLPNGKTQKIIIR